LPFQKEEIEQKVQKSKKRTSSFDLQCNENSEDLSPTRFKNQEDWKAHIINPADFLDQSHQTENTQEGENRCPKLEILESFDDVKPPYTDEKDMEDSLETESLMPEITPVDMKTEDAGDYFVINESDNESPVSYEVIDDEDSSLESFMDDDEPNSSMNENSSFDKSAGNNDIEIVAETNKIPSVEGRYNEITLET